MWPLPFSLFLGRFAAKFSSHRPKKLRLKQKLFFQISFSNLYGSPNQIELLNCIARCISRPNFSRPKKLENVHVTDPSENLIDLAVFRGTVPLKIGVENRKSLLISILSKKVQNELIVTLITKNLCRDMTKWLNSRKKLLIKNFIGKAQRKMRLDRNFR